MRFIKKSWGKIILSSYVFLTPLFFLYADGETDPGGKIRNPLGDRADTIHDFIRILLEGVLRIGIPIVALAVIYSGFLFVKAMGKPEELTRAKNALLYTLIGAVILLGSWAIAKLIAATVTGLEVGV